MDLFSFFFAIYVSFHEGGRQLKLRVSLRKDMAKGKLFQLLVSLAGGYILFVSINCGGGTQNR